LDRFYSAIAARLREIQPDGGNIWARKRRPEIIYRVLRGARNERPTPLRQKKPLTMADYQYLADPKRFKRKLDEGKTWGVVARERAILLFGLASGVRRSELAVLRLSDVSFEPRGVVVRIAQSISARRVLGPSKTDTEGTGRRLAVLRAPDAAQCPVRALESLCTHVRDLAQAAAKRGVGPDPDEQPDAWCIFLPARPSPAGRVLVARPRSHIEPSAVLRCVQEAAAELGKHAQDFGAHSLRAGFVTIAADNGATIEEIMSTTGHQSFEQVRGYIRRESPFDRNASRVFFEPRNK
jgi:integrase